MGIMIEDGTGGGKSVRVTEDNRLAVTARVLPRISYLSKEHGESYSWSHSYDYSAADTILLVTNNSTTKQLYISSVAIAADTTSLYQVHCPAYPTLAGTLITGVNLNRTSGNLADAVAYGNETGNTQANVIHRGIALANAQLILDLSGSVILGYHASIGVDLTTAGTLAAVTILGWFEEPEI